MGAEQHWLRLTGLPPRSRSAASLGAAHLELDPATEALLRPHMDLVRLRLKESPGVAAFLVELRNLAEQAAAAAPPPALSLRVPSFYSSLKEDIDVVGWDRVEGLAADLSSLTLLCLDVAGRRHALGLAIPPGYPSTAPLVVTYDLPTAFALRWGPGARLSDALDQFTAAVTGHQQLWDELDALDRAAWVIEPTAPPRACAWRRLALEKHVTVALALDPGDPLAAPPELKFMGSDRAVEPMLERVRANRPLWRPEESLLVNLEALLGAPLPAAAAAGGVAAEDVGADCAICYNYRRPREDGEGVLGADDEGDVPEVCCDQPTCGKPFHRLCLREWLAADATARQSFDTLFGACPYCSGPISVKIR